MFKSLGLLSNVPCPEHCQCNLAYCIFSHELKAPMHTFPETSQQTLLQSESFDEAEAGPRKRRRITDVSDTIPHNTQTLPSDKSTAQSKIPAKSSRSISPPPLRRHALDTKVVAKTDTDSITSTSQNLAPKAVPLNPRMLSNAPAPHAKRMQLIKIMFEHLDRLNQLLSKSADSSDQALVLSREGLILQALEEEETAATKNPSIYENIVKMRIMRLKKMNLADWKTERVEQIAQREKPRVSAKSFKPSDTQLSPSQEIAFLPKLVAKQAGLEKHGYITANPSSKDVQQAQHGLESARGWEECDRCKTRFQVFEGRRSEDGALTSGGKCTYHPAKARRPLTVDKAGRSQKDLSYPCCKENVGGSVGCTTAATHVFKVTNPARLELLAPFQRTPENPNASAQLDPVCFDCEMGYTTCGMEMIRLTVTSFPKGATVLDILVRPQGEILDFNSRYSGVWPEDFAKATPYESGGLPQTENSGSTLSIVDSPATARKLLFSYLHPSTPLIGHALDNDLNSARIIHPTIVDTVLLFPHPRGLPIRFGLKMLTKKYLEREIQIADGSKGHDSKEDAIAAGDLVRYKIQETWAKMSSEGWTAEGTDFRPPKSRADAIRDDIRKLK